MNTINNYKIGFLLLASLIVCMGCKKETTKGTSKVVKVSYPQITLNGNEIAIVAIGATYVDAGAKLKDDISGKITDIQPTSSNVNTAQPGLYIVTFTAANANGFETSVTRRVAVTSVTGTPNRGGIYLRPATGIVCLVEKIADGVYKVTNPGGASIGAHTTVYFVETIPDTFVCPEQPTDYGPMSVVNINFTATGATWKILNASYGTGVRTFIKQ